MADRELPVHLYGHHIGTLADSADDRPILRSNPAGKWRLNSRVRSRWNLSGLAMRNRVMTWRNNFCTRNCFDLVDGPCSI